MREAELLQILVLLQTLCERRSAFIADAVASEAEDLQRRGRRNNDWCTFC